MSIAHTLPNSKWQEWVWQKKRYMTVIPTNFDQFVFPCQFPQPSGWGPWLVIFSCPSFFFLHVCNKQQVWSSHVSCQSRLPLSQSSSARNCNLCQCWCHWDDCRQIFTQLTKLFGIWFYTMAWVKVCWFDLFKANRANQSNYLVLHRSPIWIVLVWFLSSPGIFMLCSMENMGVHYGIMVLL